MKKNTILIFIILSTLVAKSQTEGQLKVTVTTVAYGGTFTPRNVFAVWVQSKTSVFVKTMLAYADTRKAYLSNWKTATSSTYNVVDAITGATQSTHGTYTCTWSGTNITGTVLGDDTYTVAMEMDEGGNTKYATFTFKKSGTVQTVTPVNVTGFSNIKIQWTPAFTALENTAADKLVAVYPNPAVTSIYVAGIEVTDIQVCSLNGKVLLSSKQSNVNISTLPKGIYLAIIYAKEARVVRKIEKL
ncbi:MAG: DUF2271 domain-containing protein [Paludibacter sp.]|nr:DUF2271 domain-containing protein [Paludibacter sp.]